MLYGPIAQPGRFSRKSRKMQLSGTLTALSPTNFERIFADWAIEHSALRG